MAGGTEKTEPEPDKDFLLSEYQSLRSEIMQHQQARASNERYGAAAIVAVYAWLVTNSGQAESVAQPFIWFGWWLPVFIAVFGFFRQMALRSGVQRAGEYLAEIQSALSIADFGWERRLIRTRKAGRLRVSSTSTVMWVTAMSLTVMIAITATLLICSGQECGPTALNDLAGFVSPVKQEE